MKTLRKRNCYIVLFLMLFSVCTFISLQRMGIKDVNAYSLKIEREISSVYELGTEFNIPSATFNSGDKSVVADNTYLVYPDNCAKSGEQFLLNQLGLYKLCYSATIDGEFIKEQKTFYVKSSLWQFSSKESSLEYQDELLLAGFKDEKGYKSDVKSGLKINLASSDILKYNKPIDLNELGGDKPLIHLYYYSNSRIAGNPNGNTIQSKNIFVKLIDCYNQDNVVTIRFRENGGNYYVAAGSSSQALTGGLPDGKLNASRREVFIDGNRYCMYYNENFGALSSYRASEQGGYALYFDNDTKRVSLKTGTTTHFVTDLDEPIIYDNKLFSGFTTGEVYLTVSVSEMKGSAQSVDLEITKVNGSQVVSDNSYMDEKSPKIVIDGYDNEVINIAQNQPFKLLNSQIFDINGIKEKKVLAYYGYGSQGETEIAVVDGYITPKRCGQYTVVYKALDTFNNESICLVNLNSVDCPSGKNVDFSVAKLQDINAGQKYTLPDYYLESLNGGEYCRIYLKNKSTNEEKEILNGILVAESIGLHELVYEYGDKYSNYTYSYELNAVSSDEVVFSNLNLPKYFLKGYKYSLDQVTATTFNGAKEEVSFPSIYLKEDGGSYSSTPIDIYNFEINANNSVQFKFVKSGKILESEVIKVVKVLENDNVIMKNYFDGNFTSSADISGVTLDSNVNSGDNTLNFVNVISLSNFNISLNIPKDKSNYKSVNITLTDYYKRDNSLEFSIEKGLDGLAKLGYSGLTTALGAKQFDGCNCSLFLDLNSKKIIEDNSSIEFTETFTSDKVLLSISLEQIDGSSSIIIKEINGQPFSNTTSDYIYPTVCYDGKNYGIASINSIITISKMYALDVLSPYLRENSTVTVKDASGNIVTSVDGVLMSYAPADRDYQIKATSYGRYSIDYNCVDQMYNSTNVSVFYSIADEEPPVIKLKDVAEKTIISAKKNDLITIKDYTVSDNTTQNTEINVKVVVELPTGENLFLKKNSKTFKADKVGKYKIKYFCLDKEGNSVLTYYFVEVK